MGLKLTRQGVRDLGSNNRKRRKVNQTFVPGCDHKHMRPCCDDKDCGHYECPDCGLYWDDGVEMASLENR